MSFLNEVPNAKMQVHLYLENHHLHHNFNLCSSTRLAKLSLKWWFWMKIYRKKQQEKVTRDIKRTESCIEMHDINSSRHEKLKHIMKIMMKQIFFYHQKITSECDHVFCAFQMMILVSLKMSCNYHIQQHI